MARHRRPGRPSRRTAALLVPVTAAAAGLLFATSASTADGTDLRAAGGLRLSELVARARRDLAQQEASAGELRAQVEAVRAQAAAGDARVAAAAPGPALEAAAGLTEVTGRGVTVQLDDAPRGTAAEHPDDLVVHQQDLQSVVNALWAGGAQGVTLMGRRIISTTAVRCVGNTVVLQGQVYGPPFTVTAVGEPVALRAALDREPGVLLFLRYVERYGLGYRAEAEDRVALPPYDGPLELPSVARGPR